MFGTTVGRQEIPTYTFPLGPIPVGCNSNFLILSVFLLAFAAWKVVAFSNTLSTIFSAYSDKDRNVNLIRLA